MFFAFTTIVQGAAPGGKEAAPSLRLARTNRERASITAYLSAPDRPTFDSVDLSSNIMIAVFLGLQPTSGHQMEILSIEGSRRVLHLSVNKFSPAPEDLVRQGFENPYHVIQVMRRDFNRYHFASYRLLDTAGAVLSEGLLNP